GAFKVSLQKLPASVHHHATRNLAAITPVAIKRQGVLNKRPPLVGVLLLNVKSSQEQVRASSVPLLLVTLYQVKRLLEIPLAKIIGALDHQCIAEIKQPLGRQVFQIA